MIDNPFAVIERRLNRLESLLLELKEKTHEPKAAEESNRCTFAEALEITGLSKSKLYKLTSSNSIPHKYFGNRLVFSRKELLAWIEAQTVSKDNSREACLTLANSAKRKTGRR